MILTVVAGVITDSSGRVLITQRRADVPFAGCWEFPGGKLNPQEAPLAGLARELTEELGITLTAAQPLITVHHDNPLTQRRLWLSVYRVTAYHGQPNGCEGQPLRWCDPQTLDPAEFPPLDRPVIRALQLPNLSLITPEPTGDVAAFVRQLERALQTGIQLVQLRAKSLTDGEFAQLAQQVSGMCQQYSAQLVFNRPLASLQRGTFNAIAHHGWHLTAADLSQLTQRPTAPALLGVSCHTAADLRHAAQVEADYALLSPVQPTRSHPDAQPLGWEQFSQLVATANLPVYALGGVGREHLIHAQQCGAQGIAAIRGLWRDQSQHQATAA
ncbi:Nudix family hydrolase [Rhodoferax sp. 4810]|uniref:8-oxo-dGTP diphosphatase n=1 Tax=Thiospirillum jenense TaxID=1653858 RepID=A0A839H9S4_9GAMM|nr:Nudix family hydrolase [Thiospirillum jenense]MBB1073845.1 Nudix family hydrolase [Rhodoferax jenense]MBB1125200.1 Nudix family hydrolase [Thiospirillum jenense]